MPHMFDNDMIGDCVAAALANAAIGQAELTGFDLEVPIDDVVRFYSQVGGYTPSDPNTDIGLIVQDAMRSQSSVGFNIGAQAPLVGAYAAIPYDDRALMANAVAQGGAVILGVNLAAADETRILAGGTWDTAEPGDQTPGSWGPHAIILWDYEGLADDSIVRLGTWGKWQRATWGWLASRCDEAWLVIWRNLMRTDHLNFSGIDYDKLVADERAGYA